MDLWLTLVLQALPLLALLYWYVSRRHSYWTDRGVPGPKPTFLFGDLIHKAKSTVEIEDEWRQRYGRVYGSYEGLDPVLTITDVEAIKQLMLKDFPEFVNRRKQNVYHEVMNENLFALEDEKWKAVRTVTTPAFTSGKLRGMQVLMNRCVDKLIDHFNMISSKDDQVFKTKEVVTRFTIDVIASTSFAVDTNANETGKPSPFVHQALRMFNIGPLLVIPILMFPLWLNQLLGIKFGANRDSINFFIDLCRQVVKQRKADPNIRRNDLVQLLLDARVDLDEIRKTSYDKLTASMDENIKSNDKKTSNNMKSLTDNEIVAQCILFFIAGFETTATAISFALHELAINPDIQERLAEEVKSATSDIEDETSEEYFETVQTKIPYLEAVMKETLRKYPSVTRLERRANKDGLVIGGVELKKDQLVQVSTYAVHMDPEYFPDPKRWNPERFMPENKDKLVPYTYLPFGTGPRNCVGMRFAYQEIKLCLARVITHFRFRRAPTTKEPVEFRKGAFLITPVTLDLAVEKR